MFPVRNSDSESRRVSKIKMLPLVTPSFLNPVRIPTSEAPGIALKNACTPREKSRLSMTFSTVGSSGKPSKNLSVPSRDSTESGVVICAGIRVVIFIFMIVFSP